MPVHFYYHRYGDGPSEADYSSIIGDRKSAARIRSWELQKHRFIVLVAWFPLFGAFASAQPGGFESTAS